MNGADDKSRDWGQRVNISTERFHRNKVLYKCITAGFMLGFTHFMQAFYRAVKNAGTLMFKCVLGSLVKYKK